MCTKWFLGTGGGDGRLTMFENWDEEKFQKYNVSRDSYDHHDIAARPTILIDKYHKHKHPYLTMIHLWDQLKYVILSYKYDPLDSGKEEAGMPQDDSTLSSLSSASASRRNNRSPTRRGKSNDKGDGGTIRETMREMITLMSNSEKSPAKRSRDDDEARITSNSIEALYKLYDKHMNHLNFLKDKDLFPVIEKQR